MKFGKFGKRLTAAVLTMTMAIQFSATTMQAAAASNTEYMSELILSYGKTDKEAKDWLIQNGYTVLNQNLNQGGEGGSDALSWLGLSSEKRSVYLGYKTTNDPKEAITDMKIMNMNGGYSYQAYEKILEETKQEKEHFLENLMVALNEYRDNYKAGEIKAQIAHDNLNKFKDDDSGQLMGDLLLNSLKSEDEAAYEADPSQHADMVTILMQGNSTCVSEIMQNLALGAGTGETSWLNAALANSGSFDEFFQKFIEERPGLTEDDAIALMTAEYDDYAKMFASSLVGLKNYLSNYTQSGLSIDATQEEADAYFAEHEFESPEMWAGAANLFTTLSNMFYGDVSLINYLVYTEDDFLTDTSLLDSYAEFNLPQRAKLYPFIAEMSAGERVLLEYTALDRMLTMGLMDETTWATVEATMNDPAYGTDQIEPCSMFAEVNRDDFQVGSIAVTNMALGKEASTGEPIDNGVFGVGIEPLTAGLFVGSLSIGLAGLAISVLAAPGTKTMVIDGSSIVGGVSGNLGIHMPSQKVTTIDEMIIKIDKHNRFFSDHVKSWKNSSTGDIIEAVKNDFRKDFSYKLTLPGADKDVTFFASTRIDLDANGNVVSITNCDGKVYNLQTGKITYDPKLQSSYDDFMHQVNPDVKAAYERAQDIGLDEAAQNLDDAKNAMNEFLEHADADDHISGFLKEEALPKNIARLNDAEVDEILKNDEIKMWLQDPDGNTDEFIELQKNYREAQLTYDEVKKAEVANKMDDIIEGGEDAQQQLEEQADNVMDVATGSEFWKNIGICMAIVGLFMAVSTAYGMLIDMKNYYHMDMLPIPRKMVDISYLEDGSSVYVYYDCTRCNRNEMNMQNETLEDYGDMNGDVMKEWLALYTTKDVRAGNPIQAGFTKKVGTTSIPMGKKPLSFFGFDYAVNMTDERFTYNDKSNGIYLYYSQSSTPAYSGTAETSNAYIAVGVLSALGGAGIFALITNLTGKRKKQEIETV